MSFIFRIKQKNYQDLNWNDSMKFEKLTNN